MRIVRFGKGATGACSGALIGPRQVLTANHCGPVTAEGDLRGVGYSALIGKDGEVLAECREEPGIATGVLR